MLCRWMFTLCGLCLFAVLSPQIASPGDKKEQVLAKLQPTLVAQLGHTNEIESVAFSPDGKQLLSGSHDATVLWDVETGNVLRRFQGADAVMAIAFSPDGKTVFTGSWKKVQLWDAATGKELQRFTLKTDDGVHFFSVAFSADRKQVLAGHEKTARLCDVATGKEIRDFHGDKSGISSVAFSPDGKQVLVAGFGATAWLSDVATGKVVRRFQPNTNTNQAVRQRVAFSADGKQLLTSFNDKTARLWDAATGQELGRFQGHTGHISSVAFSPDGKQVVTGSYDQTVRLWDAATAKELRRLEWHTTAVMCVAFSPDGKKIASGSRAGAVALWDATTGTGIRLLRGDSHAVFSLAFRPDKKQLLTAGNSASAWDLTTGQEHRLFQGDIGYISSVALSRDGKFALTGSNDKKARLWDASTGEELRQFQGHSGAVHLVAFSPDGKQVLTASHSLWPPAERVDDDTVRLWDVATGNELRRFVGHSTTSKGKVFPSRVDSIAFSPDGKKILTAGLDQTSRLWDAATGRELHRFEGKGVQGWPLWAAFSPDGKKVLTHDSYTKTATLWDEATGQQLHSFSLLSGFPPVFSPDSKQLLVGNGQTVELWDVAMVKQIRRFEKHTNIVSSVTFSPDGRQVITASLDGMVKLWNSKTGKELCSLVSFFDATWAVTDPEGRFDAANGGNVEGLHWVAGNEPIALKQLKERYYDPGLLAKYMGFNKEPLREVKAFNDVKLFPAAYIGPLAKEETKLTLNLTNQGGGIGKVQVFVNGRELLADARGPKFDPDAATAT